MAEMVGNRLAEQELNHGLAGAVLAEVLREKIGLLVALHEAIGDGPYFGAANRKAVPNGTLYGRQEAYTVLGLDRKATHHVDFRAIRLYRQSVFASKRRITVYGMTPFKTL